MPIPERPLFRLTKNFEAGLGIFGRNGLFKFYLKKILKIIKKNSIPIVFYLEPFVNDPLAEDVPEKYEHILL